MLRDLLGRGERVTVNLQMRSEVVSGLQASSVWGTLPGMSDEEILIIAHMDGYFQAASDNASGLAAMMGLLEHFAKIPQSERPRTIRFLGSVGHHSGPGTRWLHDNLETALANTVLAINLEHVALVRTKYWGPTLRKTNAVSPMRWWVWGSDKLLGTVLDSFNRFNVAVTGDMEGGGVGRDGQDGSGRPDHSGHYVSRDQAYRARHSGLGSGRGLRADHAGLRQDHRWCERARS